MTSKPPARARKTSPSAKAAKPGEANPATVPAGKPPKGRKPDITPELSPRMGSSPTSISASSISSAASPRSPSSASSRRCGTSTARTNPRRSHLRTLPTTGAVGDPGAGRECRRHRYRRRAGGRLQDGEPQPSLLHRALSGRGDRRRRHPARRLHHGRAADRRLNALRFGAPDASAGRAISSRGVVAGIGGYGNSFGVPTVGGEVDFDTRYDGNILVNAMAVGLAQTDKIFYAAASGVGMPIVYLGSKTGRDGIHGATMASAEFDDGIEEKRPTVQVGDPFTEKLPARGLPRDHGEGLRHRHPGHGRGRPHLLGGRDGRQGRSRHRARSRRGAVPRDRHERLRDDALGEPGAHAHGAQARRRSRRPRRSSGNGDSTSPSSATPRRRLRFIVRHGGEVMADLPIKELGDEAPVYDRPHADTPEAAGARGRRRDAADLDCRRAAEADRLARPLLQALGVGAIRSRHPRQHRAAARAAMPRWCASTMAPRRWR